MSSLVWEVSGLHPQNTTWLLLYKLKMVEPLDVVGVLIFTATLFIKVAVTPLGESLRGMPKWSAQDTTHLTLGFMLRA